MSIYSSFELGYGAEVFVDRRESCPITLRILDLGR